MPVSTDYTGNSTRQILAFEKEKHCQCNICYASACGNHKWKLVVISEAKMSWYL
jgi:hypothetical protein